MKALIVVDIQNDFCYGGRLEVKNANDIIPIVNKYIDDFNEDKSLVVGTKDVHPINHKCFANNSTKKVGQKGLLNGLNQIWWPIHCVENTFGADFHSDLREIKNVICKGMNPEIDSYSAFFDNGYKTSTDLYDLLKKNRISKIFVVGLATDYCIKHTVLDAIMLGFEVYVIKNGCKAVNFNISDEKNAYLDMKKAGAKVIPRYKTKK